MERHLSGVHQPEASQNKYVQLNRRLQAILSTYAIFDGLSTRYCPQSRTL